MFFCKARSEPQPKGQTNGTKPREYSRKRRKMKYTINRQKNESAYLQLYHALREDIVAGALENGSRLPSKRYMASELGISVITVEHSYALLEDEGYVRARPRSGYYVSFGSLSGGNAESRAAGSGKTQDRTPHIPQAPITEAPEDFPFTVLARVMRNVLSEKGRQLLVKSPNSGIPELRETLARYLLRSRGLPVSPEQILIGSGAEYFYGLTVQLLGRDTVYAVEDPCYPRILEVYNAHGARSEGLPMGPDGIRTEALRECGAGVLHITPYSSYPSGITANATKRHEYVDWARTHGSIIVEDDYDSEFASPKKQVETVASLAPERVIYINTFTKTLAPSMRMGYMVLPPKLLALYAEKLDFYACTVPVFEQYVLEEFIREGHLERYINARRRKKKTF